MKFTPSHLLRARRHLERHAQRLEVLLSATHLVSFGRVEFEEIAGAFGFADQV